MGRISSLALVALGFALTISGFSVVVALRVGLAFDDRPAWFIAELLLLVFMLGTPLAVVVCVVWVRRRPRVTGGTLRRSTLGALELQVNGQRIELEAGIRCGGTQLRDGDAVCFAGRVTLHVERCGPFRSTERRLLRPDGRHYFLERGTAPQYDAWVRRTASRWVTACATCHVLIGIALLPPLWLHAFS